jgi:hypothetical protein
MNNENKKSPPECPEENELQQYLDGKLAPAQAELIEKHLAVCDRCYLMLKVLEPSNPEDNLDARDVEPPRKIPDWIDGYAFELTERQKKINANKRTLEEVLNDGGVKFAQMWKPKTDNILLITPKGNEYHSFIDFNSVPHFVVVVTNENEKILDHELVGAFPIHDEEDLINKDDLLLKKENSPTGYSFFVQSWNQSCKILVDNLDVCIGEINFHGQEDLAKKLKKLGKKLQSQKVAPYSDTSDGNIPELGIDKEHFAKNFKVDPLARYRYKEYKETAYLRVPAEMLQKTAELQKERQSSIFEILQSTWGKVTRTLTFVPKRNLSLQPGFNTPSEKIRYQTEDQTCQVAIYEIETGELGVRISSQKLELANRKVVLSITEKNSSPALLSIEQKLKPYDERWLSTEFRISRQARQDLSEGIQFQIELKK